MIPRHFGSDLGGFGRPKSCPERKSCWKILDAEPPLKQGVTQKTQQFVSTSFLVRTSQCWGVKLFESQRHIYRFIGITCFWQILRWYVARFWKHFHILSWFHGMIFIRHPTAQPHPRCWTVVSVHQCWAFWFFEKKPQKYESTGFWWMHSPKIN